MNKCTERLMNGLVKENPTFVLMLGMCPTLANSNDQIEQSCRTICQSERW